MASKEKIIMGIDPGTNVMGYALLHCFYSPLHCKILSMGVIKLDKIKDPYLKLRHIFNKTISLIEQYHPDELSIESPFYGKNPQSMFKLGRAQGASIAAAVSRDVAVTEYSPKEIKLAVTGNGNADKQQVSQMLTMLFRQRIESSFLDATDALGVAYCHYHRTLTPFAKTKKSTRNWKDFIKQQSQGRKEK